ncbi:MAG: hypothetical protein IPK00_00025 [Deltaproteobacteria bacterium]|nr:hypothetical protein [Deltaproteobacteria bacterium]
MPKRSIEEIRERRSKRYEDALKPLLLKPEVRSAIAEIEKGAIALRERISDPMEFEEYVGFKWDYAPANAWKTCQKNGVGVHVYLDSRGLPVASPFPIDSEATKFVRINMNEVFPNSTEADGPPPEWIKIEYRRNAPLDVVIDEFAELVRNLREMGKTWDLGNPDRGKPARRRKSPGSRATAVALYLRRCLGEKPKSLAKEFEMSPDAIRQAISRLTKELGLRAPSDMTDDDRVVHRKCRACEDFYCADCPIPADLRKEPPKTGPGASLQAKLGARGGEADSWADPRAHNFARYDDDQEDDVES